MKTFRWVIENSSQLLRFLIKSLLKIQWEREREAIPFCLKCSGSSKFILLKFPVRKLVYFFFCFSSWLPFAVVTWKMSDFRFPKSQERHEKVNYCPALGIHFSPGEFLTVWNIYVAIILCDTGGPGVEQLFLLKFDAMSVAKTQRDVSKKEFSSFVLHPKCDIFLRYFGRTTQLFVQWISDNYYFVICTIPTVSLNVYCKLMMLLLYIMWYIIQYII